MAMESTPPRPPPPAPGLSPAPPSSTPGVLRTLFVYGPMMSEEAITALIGRVPTMRPAMLPGHVRCCRRGADGASGVCTTHRGLVQMGYPAATATGHPTDVGEGVLLERLRGPELQLLDYYESDEYNREVVKVRASNGFGAAEETTAFAYLWPTKHVSALELRMPWHYTDFRAKHMRAFIEQVIKPCRVAFEKEQGKLEVLMTARESARSHRAASAAKMTYKQQLEAATKQLESMAAPGSST